MRAPVKGILIPVEGPSQEVEISGLADMQAACDGYVEAVTLSDGSSLYLNEEGRINGMPPNYFASDVCGLGGRPDLLLLGVRGPALLLGPVDGEGYNLPVTEAGRRWVARVEGER